MNDGDGKRRRKESKENGNVPLEPIPNGKKASFMASTGCSQRSGMKLEKLGQRIGV